MTERKCANCMWWSTMADKYETGECRGGPPQLIYNANADDFHAFWPRTLKDRWCGAFRSKEPEA
jgi:hypothetical protein